MSLMTMSWQQISSKNIVCSSFGSSIHKSGVKLESRLTPMRVPLSKMIALA